MHNNTKFKIEERRRKSIITNDGSLVNTPLLDEGSMTRENTEEG
jgi:hypothetical protein